MNRTHKLAMEAKFKVFKAQDALLEITDEQLYDEARKRLDRIRTELEQLDNLFRSHVV